MKRFLRLMICGVLLSAATAATASGQMMGFDGGGFMPFQTVLNAPYPMRFWLSGTAANSGLGYEGSYFTAGTKGLIGEDAIGGRWLLEARGHVAQESGQLFGNIGAERMWYLEPAKADLGIGVWYDVDADQEEIFGHTFHEVGVSGVIKTENFDLRGNGYFPFGNREFLVGEAEDCFFENFILIQRGFDVALTGFDAELRLRLPEMHMFSGTLDIGGYYYGADSIESFGGFRARLGVQALRGIAFNVELDHDERFQSTGYLQVVVNFGGHAEYSPTGRDLEPTVRNDHIVRVHQDPLFATNPDTGALWRVIHVDNTNLAFGDGTVENPFNTLKAAEAASLEDDIILVREGDGTTTGMDEGIILQDRQLFLGDGVAHFIPTVEVGLFQLCNDVDGNRPTITNLFGDAVTLADDNVVSGFIIDDADTAIFGGVGVTLADVNRNLITGGQNGVLISGSSGTFDFTNNTISDTTDVAFEISGGDPIVTWNGQITNTVISDEIVRIENVGAAADIRFAGVINDTNGTGILIDNLSGTALFATTTILNDSRAQGIRVLGSDGTVTFENTTIIDSNDEGVQLQNNTGTIVFENLSITNSDSDGFVAVGNGGATIETTGNNFIDVTDGVALSVSGGAETNIDMIFNTVISDASPSNGVFLQNASGTIFVNSLTISESTNDSLVVQDSDDIDATFRVTNITGAGVTAGAFGNGVFLDNNPTSEFFFDVLNITTDNGGGLIASDSGTITVNSGTINVIGGPAIDIDPTDIDLTFQNVSSDASISTGINLDTVTGSLVITGATNITNSAAAGINLVNNTGGSGLTANFGTTTLDQVDSGINLQNNAGSVFTFNNLDIVTTGGAGIAANDGGTAIFNGALPTIDATGGPAIDLENTEAITNGVNEWVFANASSTDSTTHGIRIVDLDDPVTVNAGTITNATLDGVNIRATTGTTEVTISGMTIDANQDGIDVAASAGTATVLFEDNDITQADSVGMRVNTSGTGTVNFTGTNNSIVSTGDSLDAVVTGNTTIMRLNITGTDDGTAGTPPATDFSLNNGSADAADLSVRAADVTDFSNLNNGVTVDENATTITYNATLVVPTP